MCVEWVPHTLKGLPSLEKSTAFSVRGMGGRVTTLCQHLVSAHTYPLQSPELTLSQKVKAKLQNPDLLELCHLVPKEVVQLGEAWGGQDGWWSLL